jgi:hypothetical protein
MGAAEGRAVERGCHSAWVDTFSFQAPGFYPKLGYEVFGELDYPPGHKRIFLQKRLSGGPAQKFTRANDSRGLSALLRNFFAFPNVWIDWL